jgi:hypothetical protein
VPEQEIFEALHAVRRKLVGWLRAADGSLVDELMDAVVRVSESEGSLLPRADEAKMRWAAISGEVNRGRFQHNGARGEVSSAPRTVANVEEDRDKMQVDVQVMQLTLTGAQPQALDGRAAKDQDVIAVFGYVAMQACLTQKSSLRSVLRIVGRSHTIARWAPNGKQPVQDFFRQYYPNELFPSEKAWLPAIFEPVRLKYMNGPQPPPLEIFLPDAPLPQDATVAYLIGKKPDGTIVAHARTRTRVHARTSNTASLIRNPTACATLCSARSLAARACMITRASELPVMTRAACVQLRASSVRSSSTACGAWCTSTASSRSVGASTVCSSTPPMRASRCATRSPRPKRANSRGLRGSATVQATHTAGRRSPSRAA